MMCNMYMCMHTHMFLQAEAVTKPRTFADACAHPSAKRVTVCGRTGPVNAVEADGVLFIEDDEAEAKAEAIRAKAMEPASEVTAASKAVATTAAASELAAPAPAPEPAVATAALDSKPSCAATSPGPKLSAAASKLSVDLKRPSAASQPAAAVLAPLEVNMECPHVHTCLHGLRIHTCRHA